MKILIKNGRLLDPGSGFDGLAHIAVENGIVMAIMPLSPVTPSSSLPGIIPDSWADEMLDATNRVVAPGFIDIHVHLREPGQEHKETITSGSRAAVRGGFTTIACMPNTTPVNDNPDITQYILARAQETHLVNVIPVAAITRGLAGRELTDMEALKAAGAGAFSDDGKCVMNPSLFRRALEFSLISGLPVMEHPEDHLLSGDAVLNEGEISRRYGLPGISAASEDNIVARDIELQKTSGGRLHLTHLSTRGAAEMVRKAREDGQTVTSDVTPHHLLLTEDDIARNKHGMYKMKPPLRTEQDRQAMLEAIRSGVIDCIATDHAPHSPEEKNQDFKRAPFGVIGMETAFSVLHDRLVRTSMINLKKLVELMSTNPAKVMSLPSKGRIKQGMPADLTILDPEKPFKIDPTDFQSKSSNCPFIGWEGKGAVVCTINSGRIVYRVGI